MDEILRRLGYHEAGHYLTARLFGFETGEMKLRIYNLSGHKGSSVITPVRKLNNIQEIEKFIEDRVQVLYSGALSESLTNGKVDENAACDILEAVGGENDFDKANEYILFISNIQCISVKDKNDILNHMKKVNSNLWKKTINIVEKNHSVICTLGCELGYHMVENTPTYKEYKLSKDQIESLPEIKTWLQNIHGNA